MRIGFDASMRDARTPEEYLAAQMALCLEQTGQLPDIDELVDSINYFDDEFADKFGGDVPVSVDTVTMWVFDILKKAMV